MDGVRGVWGLGLYEVSSLAGGLISGQVCFTVLFTTRRWNGL